MRIISYSVKGLFKTYNHDIDFSGDGHLKIILGQNGIGKTAMLKIMNAFFSYNIEEIQHYYFEQIVFVFDNGQKIILAHETSDVSVSLLLGEKKKQKTVSFTEIRDTTDDALSEMKAILSKEPYRRMDNYSWTSRVSGEILTTDALIDQYKDKYPQLTKLKICGYPDWLNDIVKQVHVEMIDTKRLQSRINPEREGLSRVTWEVSETVKVYAKDFLKQLERARAEASKVAAELDRTYPNRLIQSFEKYQKNLTMNNLKKNLMVLNAKRESLMKVGLMDAAKDEVLSRNFIVNDSISVALNIYLEDSSKKLEAYDDMVTKVNLLIDLINHRFLDKRIAVEGAEGLVIRSTITHEIIGFDGLSSGEQHLFVLYYYMLFKYSQDTLLLLDEPEISLHITWQKNFIADLMRIMELNPMNILIATHAPSIVRDYWSVTQELTPIEA